MKAVKVALLGFGTVGQGAVELLQKNLDVIQNRTCVEVEVSKIYVRNPDKYSHVHLPQGAQFVTDLADILEDPEIDIVVEVMGGTTFARTCIESALQAKKNVVTANKDLLAEAGPYLMELAVKQGVDLRFEASVAGAIPIIKALYDSFGGNQITEMMGILNGTTNFILSKMTEAGSGYEEVLKEAQELGYAEADPTSDVEGYDAARKLAILGSIAFNRRLFFDDVNCEGITKIDATDIQFGKEFGFTIKLLGIARQSRKGISLNVHPMFIPNTHPLAAVRGSYNAIFAKGNGFDEAMFYGRGAGSLPTGSAIVSDVMEVARNVAENHTGEMKQFYYPQKTMYSAGKVENAYYIRLVVDNSTGVLAKVATKLAEQRISAHSVIQRKADDDTATLAIITSKCPHAYMQNLIDSFNHLRVVREVGSVIRIMAD